MMKKIFLLLFIFVSSNAKATYEKIVVLGGPVAQIVSELGLGHKIVGIDITSSVVVGLEEVPNLGPAQKINAEAVVSLKPDLVLYGSNSTNKQLLEHLKNAKIKTVEIIEENHFRNINDKVKQIAKTLEVPEQAEKIIKQVVHDIFELDKKKKDFKLRVGFIYARGANHIFLAGSNTPAHGIFEFLGIKNAFNDIEGFKPISSEGLVKGNPEYLVMLKSGVKSLSDVWEIPGLKNTIAGKNKYLIEVETLPFLGFVPSTPKHLLELIDTLEKADKHLYKK